MSKFDNLGIEAEVHRRLPEFRLITTKLLGLEAKIMKSYRVFVSYSHENKDEAEKVRKHLKNIGTTSMSDHNLAPGMSFTDEIKRYIAYSHLFIPIRWRLVPCRSSRSAER